MIADTLEFESPPFQADSTVSLYPAVPSVTSSSSLQPYLCTTCMQRVYAIKSTWNVYVSEKCCTEKVRRFAVFLEQPKDLVLEGMK